MSENSVDLLKLLQNENFPLSDGYDPKWVMESQMGSNELWLSEYIALIRMVARRRTG